MSSRDPRLSGLDDKLCTALIRAERIAHDALERPVYNRRSIRGMINRRREARVMAGHTILELITAKKAEGVWPVGVSAMRSLMKLYPNHESPMWLAMVEFDQLKLCLEGVILTDEYRPLFDIVEDGEELLKWTRAGRYYRQ